MSSVSLPAEIWARIAFYACTDGGLMGTTLQQVSQVVARGTALHKNDVIVLRSARQTTSFYHYLSSADLNLIFKRVEYMLICAGHQRENPSKLVEVNTWGAATSSDLSNVLQLVSPYLRSLTLVMTNYAILSLSSLRFPNLESLTLDRLMPILSAPKLVALHIHIPGSSEAVEYKYKAVQYIILVHTLYTQAPTLRHITVVVDHEFQHALLAQGKLRSLECDYKATSNTRDEDADEAENLTPSSISATLQQTETDSRDGAVRYHDGFSSRASENFTIVLRQHELELDGVSRRLIARLQAIDGPFKRKRFQFRMVRMVVPVCCDNSDSNSAPTAGNGDGSNCQWQSQSSSQSQFQSQAWDDMFHRAVLQDIGTAEVCAEDWQLDSRDTLIQR
jgi:hypothetical protein